MCSETLSDFNSATLTQRLSLSPSRELWQWTVYHAIPERVFCFVVLLLPTTCFGQAKPQTSEEDGKLRIICFGAHPDDAEYKSGGVAAMWARLGHHVKLVSVTNGDIGHWKMAGGALAQRRTAESALVAERLGVTSEVLDIHDGELEPTLENRRLITRQIRQWKADIVIAHRPWTIIPIIVRWGLGARRSVYGGRALLLPGHPATEKESRVLVFERWIQETVSLCRRYRGRHRRCF